MDLPALRRSQPLAHQHAVQRDVQQQADAHQRAEQSDGRRSVQRVEAHAVAARRVDGVGQQVVDIDQPAQQ